MYGHTKSIEMLEQFKMLLPLVGIGDISSPGVTTPADELVEVAVSLFLNHFDAKSSMLAFEDALIHMGRLCLEAVNEPSQDPSSQLSGFDFILISTGFSAQDSTVWGQVHRPSLIWPGQIISMSVGKRPSKTR